MYEEDKSVIKTWSILLNAESTLEYEEVENLVIYLKTLKVIDVPNNIGMTFLAIAAKEGNQNLVKALLECGADINIHNNSGNTPFDFACALPNKKLAAMFITYDPRLIYLLDKKFEEDNPTFNEIVHTAFLEKNNIVAWDINNDAQSLHYLFCTEYIKIYLSTLPKDITRENVSEDIKKIESDFFKHSIKFVDSVNPGQDCNAGVKHGADDEGDHVNQITYIEEAFEENIVHSMGQDAIEE